MPNSEHVIGTDLGVNESIESHVRSTSHANYMRQTKLAVESPDKAKEQRLMNAAHEHKRYMSLRTDLESMPRPNCSFESMMLLINRIAFTHLDLELP